MAIIFGQNIAETIFGNPEADTISGWDQLNAAGDEGPADDHDVIVAGLGGDILNGGGGNDTLYGQDDADTLNGGAGNDDLVGGLGNDILNGGAGDDDIFVEIGDGFDAINGGGGTDYLLLDRTGSALGLTFTIANAAALQTLADTTTILGVDSLNFRGGTGADTVTGGAINDWLFGAEGGDTLNGGGGIDYIVGGAGIDTLSGGDGLDAIQGGGDGDDIDGGADDDDVRGDGGVDVVDGGSGADQVYGGAGDDVMDGGADDDFLFTDAGEGFDDIDGGAGSDYLYFNRTGSTLGLTLSLAAPAVSQTLADTTTIVNIERMWFTGGSGVDRITGGALDDVVVGGAGDDVLAGGAGVDTLNGGAGSDTVTYASAAARVKVALDGSIAAEGDAAGDTLVSFSRLTGTSFGDVLFGDAAGNLIKGGAGSDTIRGLAGNDLLSGETGGDAITGGAGDDTFNYAALNQGGDTIVDFSNAAGNNDTLRFTSAAFGGLPAGTLAASRFLADAAGLATTAAHRFLYETDTGILRFDSNGNAAGGVTVIATLTGAPVIGAGDILIV